MEWDVAREGPPPDDRRETMLTAWLEFPMGRVAALLAAVAVVVGFVRHLIFRLTNPRDVYRPVGSPPPRRARTPKPDPARGRATPRTHGAIP